ncbi:small cell adhesion glycoprotein homolog [Acanthochromis polyacanthus]|uniref:small cell adhesion glycoprotein homolog n=1 Tax=Acanthochromis polyacanthus TaxID=80966 RepID=UPI000B8FF2F8|nr:small cell adhesion glycoprotein homolog [Acanthochromis polyacanthus]XP_022063867.1 small cell adhesion glycoprotein homolog [Acanthochromis polyacanthus]
MDPYPTQAPVTEIFPEITKAVTKITTTGVNTDDGDFAALIGGVVSAVLLLLICVITVSLWCLSRHKGSYVTNETDDDDDIDDESVGSDTALQSKEPLKKDDEE